MKFLRKTTIAAGLLLAVTGPAAASGSHDPAPLPDAKAAPVQLEWDARLRDERVDDDAFARNAYAETLRLRLGVQADLGPHWSTLLEGAAVAAAGNHYNSGANGKTGYPVIADPRSSELNQAWLRWHDGGAEITLGRQRLLLDNQRWVGNVGWRQLEQTYDALATQWNLADDWTIRYDWLDRVHRVSGPDALNPLARERALDTHLLNVAYRMPMQQWTGYAYLHKDRDVPGASSATYGLRWTGAALHDGNGPGWTLEAARQHDYANNPARFGLGYWRVEPSWTQNGITLQPGWEHLGGNGHNAVQTPLATLHAFNGWDDQFLSTPATGLNDRYFTVDAKCGGAHRFGCVVSYHDFRGDHAGRYGSEWDAAFAFPLPGGIRGLFKFADYHADGFGHDDRKLWLQFEWRGRHGL